MAKKISFGVGLLILVVTGFLKISTALADCQTQADLSALNAQMLAGGIAGSGSASAAINECQQQIQAYQNSLNSNPPVQYNQEPSYSEQQLLIQEGAQLNAICTDHFGAYSQFNQSTNSCSCDTGYAIGSDGQCDIVCPAGEYSWNNLCIDQALYGLIQCHETMGFNYDYSTSTNSCVPSDSVTPQTYCTDKYGFNATVGPV